MRVIGTFYILTLLGFWAYSYGFVDPNLTLPTNPLYQKFHQSLFELVFNNRPLSTIIFIFIVFLLSTFYFLFSWLVAKKRLNFRKLKWLVGITVGILLLSYPALSYDIFNYILTAKVTFLYKENPYIIMPIELVEEPNLAFTRAANKIALYGPSWIGLTAIPYSFGFNNIITTIFSFKLFITAFYLGTAWLIWKISKNILGVALFALNPLVLIETLVSAHNDIAMMFFALLAFWFLEKRKIFWAVTFLGASILIKYATIFLLPIFLYVMLRGWQRKRVNWESIFYFSSLSMIGVFLLSPLREEIYPWYVIWILSFAVLVPQKKFLLLMTLTLSIVTLLRYVPVLYTGSYFGITPLIKEIVTFVPLALITLFWMSKKFLWPKISFL